MLTHHSPRDLVVDADAARPDAFRSITQALAHASAGDVITVWSGVYSPARTGERFPLVVPPGVSLVGVGDTRPIIDGEGALSPTWRPMREDQSLVLLQDGCSLTGCVVRRSGGNGVGAVPDAQVVIEQNDIHENAEHGILFTGPRGSIVRKNTLFRNGTAKLEYETSGPTRTSPAHHIFVQFHPHAANDVVICDNELREAGSDAIGVGGLLDTPDGCEGRATVTGNVIDGAGRFGIMLPVSFSSSENRMRVEVRGNTVRRAARAGLVALAALPLVPAQCHENVLVLSATGNTFADCGDGMLLISGWGAAVQNRIEASITHNTYLDMRRSAVRAITALTFQTHATASNSLALLFAHNRVERTGGVGVFVQGAAAISPGKLTGNECTFDARHNTFVSTGAAAILVDDGVSGNSARVADGTQAHERAASPIPFEP